MSMDSSPNVHHARPKAPVRGDVQFTEKRPKSQRIDSRMEVTTSAEACWSYFRPQDKVAEEGTSGS